MKPRPPSIQPSLLQSRLRHLPPSSSLVHPPPESTARDAGVCRNLCRWLGKRRGLCFYPFGRGFVRLECADLDTVDGRPRLAHLADFGRQHFADPKHVMPLQASMNEIGGFAVDSSVEVASFDQREIDQVPAEFE